MPGFRGVSGVRCILITKGSYSISVYLSMRSLSGLFGLVVLSMGSCRVVSGFQFIVETLANRFLYQFASICQ